MNDKLLENAVKIAVEKDYKKEVTDFSERERHTFSLLSRKKYSLFYIANRLYDTANV